MFTEYQGRDVRTQWEDEHRAYSAPVGGFKWVGLSPSITLPPFNLVPWRKSQAPQAVR
jgi:hypothetical protein